MQLTKGVEYGIEGILYLARRDRDRLSLVREVSKATDIPEDFLSKIFQRLATKGLIQSRRGFRGGFRCLDHLRARGRRGRCHVRRIFGSLQRRISAILEQTTLEDLLEATS